MATIRQQNVPNLNYFLQDTLQDAWKVRNQWDYDDHNLLSKIHKRLIQWLRKCKKKNKKKQNVRVNTFAVINTNYFLHLFIHPVHSHTLTKEDNKICLKWLLTTGDANYAERSRSLKYGNWVQMKRLATCLFRTAIRQDFLWWDYFLLSFSDVQTKQMSSLVSQNILVLNRLYMNLAYIDKLILLNLDILVSLGHVS